MRGDDVPFTAVNFILNLCEKNVSSFYEGCKFEGADGWDPKAKIKEFTSKNARIVLLSSRGADGQMEQIGFLHYRWEVEFEKDCIYIYDVQLVPHFIQNGLGSRIVSRLEKIAKDQKVSTLICTCQKKNEKGYRFWEKHNFVMDENSPDLCWDKKIYYPWAILSKKI